MLKSGCAIEKIPERSIEKTAALILMYSVRAVMNMTYTGRLMPGRAVINTSGNRGMAMVILCCQQDENRAPKTLFGEGSGGLPRMAGRAETRSQRRVARSENYLGGAYEAAHPAFKLG